MEEQFEFLRQDEVLRNVLEKYGRPHRTVREPGFAAMVHIILEQQVSIASAKAAYAKLELSIGGISPETILMTSDERLRESGISRQKTAYLRDLANRVASGVLDFDSFADKDFQTISEELLAVKGVGNWSVEVYLMFCLNHPDIMPIGDIAIRHAIRELYDISDADAMTVFAERWKPFRSLASFVLWHHYLNTPRVKK